MLNDLGRALLQVPQSGYQQSAILSSHASNPSKTDAARFQNLRLDTRSRSTEEGINPSISALTEGVCPALTRLDSPANTNLTQIYVINLQKQASEKQVPEHQSCAPLLSEY